MHARQHGYRSGPVGMGMSASRRHGFNRGRGRPRAPSPGDIFMDAGRLAAEYLVSQGVLPPAVLSANFRKQRRYIQQKSKAFDSVSEDVASSAAGDSESVLVLDKYSLQDEAQSKTGSSSAGKEILQDSEISKVDQASSSLSAELKENQPVDLATLCKFGKVPTRTRSSLTAKAPKTQTDFGLNFPKRAAQGTDMEEAPLPLSGRTDSIQCDLEKQGKTLIDGAAGETLTHESLVCTFTGHKLQKGISGHGYAQECQLLPASFKICDLNLGGASDVNLANMESAQGVDFDLSVSTSAKSLEFSTSTRMSNGKEIEVIDLDNDDSPEGVKSINNPERKQEAAPYMGINDVPDYNEGLMMVEYLDSFGNIPPVNPEIRAVQTLPQNNVLGLQDREGAPGNDQVPNNTDDDSIFMSLGEIPLTFLQAWDQPPARGYNKPF